MPTQAMNTTAWAWTYQGAAKLERPMASWSENPATITRVMAIAPPRKKPWSRPDDAGGLSAIAVMFVLPLSTR